MKTIYEKHEVAKYLAKFHEEHYGSKISKIKIQKGLYFMYAFFSQFVNRAKQSEISEDFPEISNELFDAKFEAWAYGPVDREVYRSYNDILIAAEKFDINEFLNRVGSKDVADYLETLTRQIFNSSDFGLVELSHQDEAWKNHYDKDMYYPDEVIPNEEIINEYNN